MSDDYPSNSRSPKRQADTQEKKIEPVLTEGVVRRKKSLGRRFHESLVGGDARTVWGHVVRGVLIPAAQDMIADAAREGIERMIFGESHATSRRAASSRSSASSYSRPPTRITGVGSDPFRGEDPRPRADRRDTRRSNDIGEIIVPTRVAGEEILDSMYDLLSRYKSVSVADLNDLVNEPGSMTDDKWGWFALDGSRIERVRGGYRINLPRPEPLD